METNDKVLLNKLREKLKKEEERYKEASREDCIRLPRKQYFSVMQKQMRIQRGINTIKVAINFVENGLRKTDVYAALTAPTAKAVGFRRKAEPSFWCRLDSVRCCGCRERHCIPCVRG